MSHNCTFEIVFLCKSMKLLNLFFLMQVNDTCHFAYNTQGAFYGYSCSVMYMCTCVYECKCTINMKNTKNTIKTKKKMRH